MPKVKIVLAYGDYDSDPCGIIRSGLDGYEEISQADLSLLRRHIYDLRAFRDGGTPVICVADEAPLEERINSVHDIVDRIKREYDRRIKLEAKAEEEKQKAKEQRERKKLAELQKKFGVSTQP